MGGGGGRVGREGERHRNQTGAGSSALPGKSLCSRQPRFESQEGSRFYSVLKMKRPVSPVWFLLLFGWVWPSGCPVLGRIQHPLFDVRLHEDLPQSSQLKN